MTEQNKKHRVYLWSNYRGKLDPEKVSQWKFEEGSVHVFINTAKPLFADIDKFKDYKKVLFVRQNSIFNTIRNKLKKRGYEIELFSEVYRLYKCEHDRVWVCKGENDELCASPANIRNRPEAEIYSMKVKVDDFDLHDDDAAKIKFWGRTSGFMAYRFLRDMYPDSEIITVNFHRRENDNEADYLPYHNHNIGNEEKWFKEHNVKNIVLG